MTEYTSKITNFVTQTRFEDLPANVVHSTKRLILDTFGNAVGGFSTSAGKLALATKRELGGTPESTVFITGEKTSCTSAAFCNATLASALEADDTCLHLGHHGQCSVMPALAVAERSDTSGKSFITAVALAYELGARIASAMRHVIINEKGDLTFSPSGGGVNWVVFSAAIGAGKILALDQKQMAGALGIAGLNAVVPNGGRWNRPNWNHLKYNPYAFMAESGTFAALLSKNGFTGDPNIFDGDISEMRANWWQMSGAVGVEPESAVSGLGERWIIPDASIKPYPSCRFTHGPLGLFERIMADHALNIEDIEAVDIYAIRQMFAFSMDSKVVSDEGDAQFSMPHLIAMSALGITPGPKWVAPEYWNNPAVEAIKAKVTCYPYEAGDAAMVEQLLAGRWEKNPHAVTVKARGKVFELKADYSLGDPLGETTAFDDAALQRKFRNFAQSGLATAHVDQCIDLAMRLETLGSIKELTKILH
jgi:2-methylcitrate dehydratase PrpD